MTVRQVEYPSLDGTPIGLFLIHRHDVTPGPDVPMILNGYGGFAIAETPVWSPQIAAWCAAGGAFAIAGLRGGIEEGEAWHQAGRRANKQNVFDDFHAAADWLVADGLASPRSARRARPLQRRPARRRRHDPAPGPVPPVWCGVPLLDMVRFPQFLIARLWTSEYGDPDVAEEFGWLHAYSPYHHVTDGTAYPATLFSTAEGDSRVDPCTPARWPRSCRRRRRARTSGRSSCSRRTAPATASASRSPSAPTNWPTACRSWPGSSASRCRGDGRAEWLVVGGPAEPWERLGLTVVDGTVPLFGTGLRLAPDAAPGIVGWQLSGIAADVVDIDGLPTEVVAPTSPAFVEHPSGAIGLDHVVVTTDALDRTCAAIEAGHRRAAAAGARGRRDPPGLPSPRWWGADRGGRRTRRPAAGAGVVLGARHQRRGPRRRGGPDRARRDRRRHRRRAAGPADRHGPRRARPGRPRRPDDALTAGCVHRPGAVCQAGRRETSGRGRAGDRRRRRHGGRRRIPGRRRGGRPSAPARRPRRWARPARRGRPRRRLTRRRARQPLTVPWWIGPTSGRGCAPTGGSCG